MQSSFMKAIAKNALLKLCEPQPGKPIIQPTAGFFEAADFAAEQVNFRGGWVDYNFLIHLPSDLHGYKYPRQENQ